MPEEEVFPYTVRVVSDITESNGSSSMATVCGGTLALMDAGVPIKSPVAGVAMGLVMEDKKYAILTDIAGAEDHYGDMDFKVAGTAQGITALQMDIKVSGITMEIMREALAQALKGRLEILGKMAESISGPRAQTSQYAPRIVSIKIPVDKIRDVIGPGGKMIRSIIDRTGVKIDVEDDGRINVASNDEASAARALRDAGHEEIALCGIAKRLEEVWLPGEDFPVILPRTSEALYLLQRLRDEAHRFAITHQRKRRLRDIQSVLAEIPGLGEARIKALLRHFGSVAALKRATPEQIAELPGVGPKLAASIHAHLADS